MEIRKHLVVVWTDGRYEDKVCAPWDSSGGTRLAGGRERVELSRETAGDVVQTGQPDAPSPQENV